MTNTNYAKANNPAEGTARKRSGLNTGLDAIEAIAAHGRPMTMTEVAQALSITKASIHRTLATLEERHFVRRLEDQRYVIGIKAWEIGCIAAPFEMTRLATPHMIRLVSQIEDGVSLGMLSGTDMLAIQLIESPKAVRVHGMGLRLTDEIAPEMYNYGQFQVVFDDGSVGWYEAGWGPMMSETAFFVKDIVSPNGAVSITDGNKGASAAIEGHTKVGAIRVHRVGAGDSDIDMPGEPGHDDLCAAEQAYMLRAIAEDIDLTRHMQDAVESLRICLAADESIRTGAPVTLQEASS